LGGGTLYDIGIYCINAARYLFREEPKEVVAFTDSGKDSRFREVEENASVILRFSRGKLRHSSAVSGPQMLTPTRLWAPTAAFALIPLMNLPAALELEATIGDKKQRRKFPKHDQFAPELIYFSDCILKNKDPEPFGVEGLADVRIVRALCRSAEIGNSVKLPAIAQRKRPTSEQEITPPAISKPKLVNAESPSGS
jgi:predicted dehydrogenase